jgi:hypothetical protein
MDIYCSYNGVRFLTPTPELQDLVGRHYDVDHLHDIDRTANMSPRIYGLAVPNWPTPRVRLNQLFWPIGATRCGLFRGVAEKSAVESMSIDSDAFATLRLFDGLTAIEASMRMLPPRPLFEVANDPGLYLVTLVDRRWLLRRSETGDTGYDLNTEALRTWSRVWSKAMSAFPTATAPTATGRFGPEPDSAIYGWREPPAAIADATAANCGSFVWAGLNADAAPFACESWADARANLVARTPTSAMVMGGSVYGLNAFGRAEKPNIPSWVQVVFPCWNTPAGRYSSRSPRHRRSGSDWEAVRAVDVSPAFLGAPYDTLVTTAGFKILHTTAKAYYGSDADALSPSQGAPTNNTDVVALAQALARDFYDYEMLGIDRTYIGLVNVDRRIGGDITWEISPRGAFTTIRRLPFDSSPVEFQHGFPLTPFTTATSSVTVQRSDGTQSFSGSTIQFAGSAGTSFGPTANSHYTITQPSASVVLIQGGNVFVEVKFEDGSGIAAERLIRMPGYGLSVVSSSWTTGPADGDFYCGGAVVEGVLNCGSLVCPTTLTETVTIPIGPGSSGTKNQFVYNTTHLYVCIGPNNWKRIAWDTTPPW